MSNGQENPFQEFAPQESPNPFAEFAEDEEEKRRGGVLGFLERVSESAREIPSQISHGVTESGLATLRGVANLVGAERVSEFLGGLREELPEPETPGGRAARVASRVAGDIGQFAIPGGALGRLAATAGRGGRIASRIAKPTTRLGRFGREAAVGAPVSAALGASSPEESTVGFLAELTGSETLERFSENARKRAVAEVTADVLGFGALSGVGAGVRRIRKARRISGTERAAPNALPTPAVRAVADFEDASRAVTVPELPAMRELPPPRERPRVADVSSASVDPDEFINVGKLDLEEEGASLLRDEVRRVVTEQRITREPLTWEQTRKRAKEILGDPNAIVGITRAGRRLRPEEHHALVQSVASNTDRMAELFRALDNVPELSDQWHVLKGELDARSRLNDKLLGATVRARRQAGQSLQTYRIMARRNLDLGVWLTDARQIMGGDVPEETAAELHRLLNVARLSGSELDQRKLSNFMARLRPTSRWEKLSAIRKAVGLLSGPVSHARNFVSNVAFGGLEVVKDIPAYALDQLLRQHTGVSAKVGLNREMLKASFQGASDGVRRALNQQFGDFEGLKQALSATRDPREHTRILRDALREGGIDSLEKWDIFRRANFDNPWLDSVVNGIFNSYGAADKPFKGFAFARSLHEQAVLFARREGLDGDLLGRRIGELQTNPTPEMVARATSDAEFAVFQNAGALAKLGARAKTADVPEPIIFLLEWFLPFTRTPANVISRAVEGSPLGFVGVGSKGAKLRSVKRELDRARQLASGDRIRELEAILEREQKALVERFGRATVGSVAALGGFALWMQGRMTGTFPATSQERDIWALEGRQENSVKVGDFWRSIEGISPIGNLMVFGANLARELAQRQETTGTPSALMESFGTASLQLGQTVKEQSFLRGVEDFLTLFDPDIERRGTRFLASQATSLIPAVVRQASAGSDPLVREATGFGERLIAQTPLRRRLEPKIGQLGQTIQQGPGGASGALRRVIDPFRAREDRRTDALVGELSRIGANITRRRRKKGQNAEEFRREQEVYGELLTEALTELFQDPEYQAIPELVKRSGQEESVARAIQREIAEDEIRLVRSAISRELGRLAAANR